jgi:hypothetical protein
MIDQAKRGSVRESKYPPMPHRFIDSLSIGYSRKRTATSPFLVSYMIELVLVGFIQKPPNKVAMLVPDTTTPYVEFYAESNREQLITPTPSIPSSCTILCGPTSLRICRHVQTQNKFLYA